MNDDKERYTEALFPSNYAGWRQCIEDKCRQVLTPDFVKRALPFLVIPSMRNHGVSRTCMANPVGSRCWCGFNVRRQRYDNKFYLAPSRSGYRSHIRCGLRILQSDTVIWPRKTAN